MIEMEINFERIKAICIVIISFQITNFIAQFLYHYFIATWVKKPLIFEEQGEWAVITGATNGLGRAFAAEFARRGMKLVLIDKDELELHYIAKFIEGKYGVQTMTIQTYFTPTPDTYRDIHTQMCNLDIGVMVSNIHELQARPAWLVRGEEDVERIVSGDVHCVTSMCRVALPGMMARGRGMLILVSGFTANFPTPLMAPTAAAKAFTAKLARDLDAELQDRGVTVRVLLPGFLQCRWLRLRAPSLLAPAPSTYLSSALPLIAVHSRTVGYWPHDLFLTFVHFIHYVHPTYANDLTVECMQLLREVSIRGFL